MAEVTPHMIVDYLLSRNAIENKTVIEAVNQYYSLVILPDVNKAPGTKRNYKKSINHLCNFLQHKKLKNTGPCADVQSEYHVSCLNLT